MPRRFLRGSYGRVAWSVVALALSVGLVCALDLVNRAVLRAFVEIVDTMAGRAALQVAVDDGGLFAEEVAATIAAVPGVELAAPVVSATVFTTDAVPEALTVHGFDLTDDDVARIYEPGDGHIAGIEDPVAFLNQRDSIILTRSFAERRGLMEGSRIELDTPTGRRSFAVRGLLDPQGIGRAYGGGLLLMDLFAAEESFGRAGFVNRVDVVVARDADVNAVTNAIAAVLPAGLGVSTPSQRKADLHAVMRSLQSLLQALGLIALAAAFMIAFNRLNAVFEQRMWLCGVMRAIGVRRGAVWWMLMQESLLLGAVGSLLGVGVGIGLGHLVLPFIATTTALNFRLVAPKAALSLDPISLMIAVVIGLGAAVLAALLPAWRASGVSVAQTIRGRGIEAPDRLQRSWAFVAVLVAAALAAAVFAQSETRAPLWGVAATVLAVVATKMMARPFLELIGGPTARFAGQRTGGAGRFVALSVERNPRRSALMVATIGIGLGAVFWLGIVAFSFEVSAVRVFQEAMRADLVVSSAHFGSGALEAPVDDRFGDRLRAVEGVDSVVGIRLANWEHAGGQIVLDAFDPDYFRNPDYGEWPLLGEHHTDVWAAVAEGRAVVVSSNFAQNLGASVGDTIELETPTGPLRLEVAGVTTDFASPRGTIEMSRDVYKRYWNDPSVTRFFVETTPSVDLAVTRERIIQGLGGGGIAWRIISSRELVDYWRDQIRRAFAAVYVLAAVILTVILFGLVDNLSAGVTERTREIGMIRALGVRRRMVSAIIVGEAFVVTALGIALALAQGVGVGELWVGGTIPYLLGWVIELHLPWGPIMGVAVTTLLSCLVAALLPAARAAAVEPAIALRWE